MFRPKRIIAYRAKPVWFTILYVALILLVCSFAFVLRSVTFNKMSYQDRLNTVQVLHNKNASFSDYKFSASKNIVFNAGEYEILLTPSKDLLNKYLEEGNPDYLIYDGGIYIPLFIANRVILIGCGSLSDYSTFFSNADLGDLDVESEFFTGLENIINKNKLKFSMIVLVLDAGSLLLSWMVIVLISFFFQVVFFQAGRFMKKSQLFKMLLFSTTAYTIGYTITTLLNLNGLLSLLIFAVSLYPLFSLEREIMMRIRIYQFSKGLIQDEELREKIRKLNERLNDKSSNKDENDKGQNGE
ncbi:MAG: hypothetical protein K6G38_01400 [Gammaproteobacteria bacterium]|nr:hypothetical protein [Gammaproteobacteria bacterium]